MLISADGEETTQGTTFFAQVRPGICLFPSTNYLIIHGGFAKYSSVIGKISPGLNAVLVPPILKAKPKRIQLFQVT